ncbi:exosortase F system-associated membrane protein [Lutibacter sp. TH_r2]|uniref:exosortase F system-associated membrane protein n=1 Tax=Lutibacter sp. TH_r2 TaxID=3082083 RepID=UPI00398810BD
MSNIVKIFSVIILFVALIFLRGIYRSFLYDPLTEYFNFSYLNEGFPDINKLKYFGTVTVRYFLNSVISLLIIFVFFNNKKVVFLALKIYVFLFLLLNLIFFIELNFNFSNTYLVLFYVRRFLIHPLLLLILLPAFYYQQIAKKN